MRLSQLQKTLWQWRSPECDVDKARNQFCQFKASIEAITKFSMISRKVVFTNRMKGTMQRPFDIGNKRVHPFELGDLNANMEGGSYSDSPL